MAKEEQAALLRPEEQVLSTLNPDGSRRWLRPKVSTGRYLNQRRVVGYILILLFTALPYIAINGKPAVLLDITVREFTLFGTTFLPTDTLLLALLIVSVFLSVFFVTALLGRVWCGWACPQTVYMELVYRPIERLFEGRNYRTGGKATIHPMRRLAKYVVYLVISMFLAHTFLAYFVGVERLVQWVQRPPLEHPTAFIIMAAVTGLMMFDFCYFREQVCTLMCPYGRFQSVMLDRQSLIISYDSDRGEPRGKLTKAKRAALSENGAGAADHGDCIDCHLCVVTCPTGIDIRSGLQMECVGCAQCIDACDEVMEKTGRPRGLIRYTSQEALETGRRRLVRARVLIYPIILIGVLAGFGFALAGRSNVDVTFLRNQAARYSVLESDDVSNQVLLKLTNRTSGTRTYDVRMTSPGTLASRDLPLTIEGGASGQAGLLVVVPREHFERGRADIELQIMDEQGTVVDVSHHVLGPLFSGTTPHGGGES